MMLIWIGLGLGIFMASQMGIAYLRVAALRRSGLYPAPGKATMADVKKLVQARKSIWAIRCYREVNPRASLKDAKNAVDKLAMAE
jgi:ribosomal protein L7/L12